MSEIEEKLLAQHWLFEMRCNHEEKTDTAFCACGQWNSGPQENVGQAALRWAEHALSSISHQSHVSSG